MKVLVTDPNYKHTLGAVRALARAGHEVHLYGDKGSLCSQSRYAHQSVSGELDQVLQREKYDVLLPIGARSVEMASRSRKRIEQRTTLALPGDESLELSLDKLKTMEFAARLGCLVPKTWHDLANLPPDASFPLIIKGRYEIGDKKVVQIRDRLALRSLEIGSGSPIAQEFIPGVGCAFFGLYQNGVLKRGFMHRRVREMPPSGGASCCAESIFEEDLFNEGKKLLDALSWHGVAMVEFRRHRDSGKLYLMEINPKFWGSLDLAIASGMNFPVLMLDVALDRDISYSMEFRRGLRFHWPLGDGEWIHALKRPASFWAVLSDCLKPNVKSNIWPSDLKPSFWLARSDWATWRHRSP